MKKVTTVIFIAALMLTGCHKTTSKQSFKVFSFHATNEQLTITNGVIILSDEGDTFYGGDLEVSKDFPANIMTYSLKFYIKAKEENQTILSNTLSNQSDSPALIDTNLGKIADEDQFLGTVDNEETILNLKNNLYFELITTDTNGEKNTYKLQMLLTEVTAESTE